jgi:hypothetical protein
MKSRLILFFVLASFLNCNVSKDEVYVRVNQVGYLPDDSKVAILFSDSKVDEKFELISSEEEKVLKLYPVLSNAPGWGRFNFYYELDFSEIKKQGKYFLKGTQSNSQSSVFSISNNSYQGHVNDLLIFMRQQRCGYNPFLDVECHQLDGKAMFGPMPDSTEIDTRGGWHDAGDQLKYLITGSYATAHMLLCYELFDNNFTDEVNDLGKKGANGLPDLLDEAKWGLDWIEKLHPAPDQLIHQIADDRDHIGWKMPTDDQSDYGWGPNSHRVSYFATGEPQGLSKFKSKATGLANLAGRSSAAMSIASRIWDKRGDTNQAKKYNLAARTLYELGQSKEGYQQGNSFKAPYRYEEITWADDMEWAAAELYKNTKNEKYLQDGMRYAEIFGTNTWMTRDTASHYLLYPFINIGHYAMYDLVDDDFKEKLANYYREEIEYTLTRAVTNPFGIGVPFIWCSNNLLAGLITQMILYEKMTGDSQYEKQLVEHRDWLFGRNPWGTSMYTGIPSDGEYPIDVHTSIYALTKKMVPGGLIDGPVYGSINRSLLGLTLEDEDEFAHLQNPFVVYHDDVGDYSTNEPTMDGTASSFILMAYWSQKQ